MRAKRTRRLHLCLLLEKPFDLRQWLWKDASWLCVVQLSSPGDMFILVLGTKLEPMMTKFPTTKQPFPFLFLELIFLCPLPSFDQSSSSQWSICFLENLPGHWTDISKPCNTQPPSVPHLVCLFMTIFIYLFPLWSLWFPSFCWLQGGFVLFCFYLLFLFLFFRTVPVAYGSSQARGQIGAATAGLRHKHSNAGSEPRLRPMP